VKRIGEGEALARRYRRERAILNWRAFPHLDQWNGAVENTV
jgi:hypothetical protein